MEVGMYLRKSRSDNAEESIEETLQRHRATLLEFAAKSGLAIPESNIYKEVVSGDALYARPEMMRLLEDVEAGHFDAVLCIDIDRLGRGSMAEQGIILEAFQSSHTKIMTPDKTIDLENAADEDYTEFKTFLSRQELKMIKRRLKAGTQRTIKDGGYIANAPYGYDRVYVDKKPTLQINEEEAKHVRLMFKMYVEDGIGCQTIADTLNSMGAKPHRSAAFGRTSVRKILKNNVYIGKIVWNQKTHIRKGAKGNAKTITIYNPKDKWTTVDGIHPPIIDEALFYKAQEIFEGRYHPPAFNGRVENPLAGLVYCKNCGGLMQRQIVNSAGGKKGPYLLCQKRGCIVSSQLQLVEEALIAQLNNQLQILNAEQNQAQQAPETGYEDTLQSIDAEIKSTEKQLDAICELLERGTYTPEMFVRREAAIKERLSQLNTTRAEFIDRVMPRALDTKAMSQRLAEALQLYPTLDAQGKNMLLKSILEKVVYNKEKGWKPGQFELELFIKPLYL